MKCLLDASKEVKTMRLQPNELLNFSKSTLGSIYKTFNSWGWPEILGEKPDGWDEMPNYRKPYMDECQTRADIIRPYMNVIKTRISHEEIYSASRSFY